MASQNRGSRNAILQASLSFPKNHGFLAVNAPPAPNLANQTRQLSSRTDQDWVSDGARSYRGSIDLADPYDFTSRITRDPRAQDETYVDDNSSEISEGSSIDHDAPPGMNETTPRTCNSQHDYSTESVSHPTRLASQMQPSLGNPGPSARLGSDSLIPTSLKDIINRWCAAKGSGYSLNQLPCTTTTDAKTISQSVKGTPATWQDRHGKRMTAKMYALNGTDLRQGQQKILVVEGVENMNGPSIVSYLNKSSTSQRVLFKRWVGVGGDTNGFEDGIAAVKVIKPQMQPPQGNQKDKLADLSTEDEVLVTSDLEHSTLGTRKRKSYSDVDLDWGLSNTQLDGGPCDTDTRDRVSVNIPSRKTDSREHIGKILESPSPTPFIEPDIRRHSLALRVPSSKRLRSHITAMDDSPPEKPLAASPKERVASATKGNSILANASTRKKLPQETAPLEYKPKVSPGWLVSQKKTASDMPPLTDPPEYESAQRAPLRRSPPEPRHVRGAAQKAAAIVCEEVILASQRASPPRKTSSLWPSQALALHLMTCDGTPISNPTAPYLEGAENTNQSIVHRGFLRDSMLGESPTTQTVYVGIGTTSTLASSHEQAIIGETQQRVKARGNEVNSGLERRISGATKNTGTSSMHVQKPGQNKEPASSPILPLTRSSTENTSDTPGTKRQLMKARRKLKLQQVFIKFNSAVLLEPLESPRVRPYSACDTVQKLFNQARTGNVFGNASDVRSGGKLLTVEFRGSGRMPDEVHIINEDDEEDFLRMRTALLRKDWWTELEERVVGGGLLDVRDMS